MSFHARRRAAEFRRKTLVLRLRNIRMFANSPQPFLLFLNVFFANSPQSPLLLNPIKEPSDASSFACLPPPAESFFPQISRGISIVAIFYPFSQFCEINTSLLSLQTQPNTAPNLFQRG